MRKCIASSTWESVDSRGAGGSRPVCRRARHSVGRSGLPDRDHRRHRPTKGHWWSMSTKRTDALRVAVLASGRGSNLQAVIDAIEAGTVQAKIVAVISNKKDAPALERARRHGLSDLFVDPKPYAGRPDSREAYDRELLDVLRQHDVELVLLAGYMKIVTTCPGRCLCKSHDEHPSVPAALVSRVGCAEESNRMGMQTCRMYGPLCDGRRG